MVKKINLTDTSSPSTATPTTEAAGTDIGPILDLQGQVDKLKEK